MVYRHQPFLGFLGLTSFTLSDSSELLLSSRTFLYEVEFRLDKRKLRGFGLS